MDTTIIFNELQSIKNEQLKVKQLTLIGVKQALTMSDAALLTGLSKSHIYKLVCNKQIPYYKSQGGKLTYFDKDELNKWLLQHRVKTIDEIEREATTYVTTGNHIKKGGAK